MIEGTRPADYAERLAALDLSRSIIVQAPAGSGKTELLIQRYLGLLATVREPESVVAITFTRKAAGEMRGRVLKSLRAAREDARPEEEHQAQTWALARRVLEQDRALGWQIEENPARLRIRTIDSLCASLAGQMPWLSRMGPVPEVAEDAVPLYREAVRNTLALVESGTCYAGAVERLLRHLDNDFRRAEDMLCGMLARRDQWLRHVTAAGPADLRRSLEEALEDTVREGLEKVRACLPEGSGEEIADLARFAAANVAGRPGGGPVAACLDLAGLPGAGPDDLPAWRGIAAMLLTKKGAFRARVDATDGFPASRRREKERVMGLLDRLRNNAALAEALHETRGLPGARYDDLQWGVMEALLLVLPVAVAQLRLVFRERGAVDFIETAQAALEALGSEDRPTDLTLALDCRIQHILVDEFQDTSFSQYRLLELLTAGWEPDDGRTIFLVGDPMQSIYRFREAEVGLFLRTWEKGIGGVPLLPLRLSVNFRSEEGLVSWVTGAFPQVMPRVDDIPTGAVSFSPSTAHKDPGTGAAVSVHAFFGKSGPKEAEAVAGAIEAARAEDPSGTIAVLVRARSHLSDIIGALKAKGIRFRAVEIDQLSDRPVIQDLLALTRALLHLADRPAWLAVLRAPWCGLTLADLEALAGEDHDAAVWDLMRDPQRLAGLSPDGRARLDRIRPVLESALARRRRRKLRRWVEGVWLRLGGPACASGGAVVEEAAVFFGLLESLGEGGDITDLERLEEQAKALFAPPDPEADESLQVMSIHKAKGLEFDTVIVPGLGRPPRRDDPPLLRWLERPGGRAGNMLLVAPIEESGGGSDEIYAYLKQVSGKRDEFEAGRLLYVASTRARKRLHLLGHVQVRAAQEGRFELKEPHAASLLKRLWPAVGADFERRLAEAGLAASAEPEELAAPPPTVLRRLPGGWPLPAAPPGVIWAGGYEEREQEREEAVSYAWVGSTLRHIGTVVHRWLLRIGREGVGRWDAGAVRAGRASYAAALAGLGVPEGEVDQAAIKVEQALTSVLASERGRWILDPGHADARCEYALGGLMDGSIRHVVIDRTFIGEDGVRWIIDYKTSTHEGAGVEAFLDNEQDRYRAQLEGYAELVASMDPRPIRLGLYYPLLDGWREWAPAQRTVAAGAGGRFPLPDSG